jgi:hypothetical protein
VEELIAYFLLCWIKKNGLHSQRDARNARKIFVLRLPWKRQLGRWDCNITQHRLPEVEREVIPYIDVTGVDECNKETSVTVKVRELVDRTD